MMVMVGVVVWKCVLFLFCCLCVLCELVVVVVARVVVDGGAVGEVETFDERYFVVIVEVKDEVGVFVVFVDDDV